MDASSWPTGDDWNSVAARITWAAENLGGYFDPGKDYFQGTLSESVSDTIPVPVADIPQTGIRLIGGDGLDDLVGTVGPDRITPGLGGARMTGGDGGDFFHIPYRANLPDNPSQLLVITDFDPSEGDTIGFVGSARAATIVEGRDGYMVHFDAGIGGQDWAGGGELLIMTDATLAEVSAATSWGADTVLI
jgi:Ca2+-binding RTX toxin-like protein